MYSNGRMRYTYHQRQDRREHQGDVSGKHAGMREAGGFPDTWIGGWFLWLARETVLLVATPLNRKLESGLWLLSGHSQFYCKKQTNKSFVNIFFSSLKVELEGAQEVRERGNYLHLSSTEKGRRPSIRPVLLTSLL